SKCSIDNCVFADSFSTFLFCSANSSRSSRSSASFLLKSSSVGNSFSSLNDGVFSFKKRRRLRSEEHTSELQSRFDLVCRLLLEKKNKKITSKTLSTYLHVN